MNFNYSRRTDIKAEQSRQRLFEIIPGLISWCILIGMLFLVFSKPLLAAIIIIAFDLYWLLRLFYMTFFLVLSYGRLSIERGTDWMRRAVCLKNGPVTDEPFEKKPSWLHPAKRISFEIRTSELKALRASRQAVPRVDDLHHLVIYPVAKESRLIVEPAIESISRSQFPSERIMVVITVEERAQRQIKEDALAIQKKFRNCFFELLVVFHPDGLPGEARVKGANATYGAKEACRFLETHNIPTENVIVSCFDADTVVEPNYFAALTYRFMICPDRHRTSYQPIPTYHNNIWNVPGFARVLAMGSSFFQLIEATDPEKLVTFSSHSMSLKALIEIGYWPVDMISDDSAVFWKALLHYNGAYRVAPMYVTLSMHVPEATTFWKTTSNIYRQQRRWAWGVENFPIVLRGFLRNGAIGLYPKIRCGFKLLENHVAWATWAFLLTVIGWLPALFAGRQFSETVLYYSAPRITATIFNLSTLALITTIFLSISLLPKKKMKRPILARIGVALEWCMIPIIFVLLSAVPALDAQTRLMLGRYMEFWVTEKEGKKNKQKVLN